jgi:hypothetical protein
VPTFVREVRREDGEVGSAKIKTARSYDGNAQGVVADNDLVEN